MCAKQQEKHVKQVKKLGKDRHIIKSVWQALDKVTHVNSP